MEQPNGECGCCDSTDLKIWTGNKKKMDFT